MGGMAGLQGSLGPEGVRIALIATAAVFLALLGYAVFGCGAALLSVAFLGRPDVWRWVGVVLLASGVASAAGFAGYASGGRVLEGGSVIGGALCLPLAALVLAGAAQL
jgi:hypothetical protein